MTYHDWNVPQNLHADAAALGWIPHAPRNVFAKSGNELKFPQNELTCVCSESSELLRAASKRAKLINPFFVRGFERDVGLVRAVAEREAFFEIPLRPLLHQWGAPRALALQRIRDFLKLCVKHQAQFVFSSQAQNPYDLKSPFETLAIWQQFGLSREQAVAALSRKVLA